MMGFPISLKKSDAGLIGRCFGEMELFDADGDGEPGCIASGMAPQILEV